MNKVAKVKEEIGNRFADNQAFVSACNTIIEQLANLPLEQNPRYYLSTFARLNSKIPEEVFAEAIAYLAGQQANAIEVGYEFYENEKSLPIELPKDFIREAIREGVMAHPLTGELVEDYMEKVVPYYVPSVEVFK